MNQATLSLAEKAKLNTWINRATYSTKIAYRNAIVNSKNQITRDIAKK